MARKIRKLYKTLGKITDLHIGIVLRDKNTGVKKQKYVDFSGGVMYPAFKPSTFWTSSPEVQKALESSKFFDVKFTLAKAFEIDDEEEDVVVEEKPISKSEVKNEAPAKTKPSKSVKVEKQPVEVPPRIEPIKVPQVKTIQGAIGNLVKQGADPDKLDTREDVEREAKRLNVSYPNLKTSK